MSTSNALNVIDLIGFESVTIEFYFLLTFVNSNPILITVESVYTSIPVGYTVSNNSNLPDFSKLSLLFCSREKKVSQKLGLYL